jgi:HD superfamily phosphodiesterase
MHYESTDPQYERAEAFILAKLKAELSPSLPYHGLHHTLDVLDAAGKIADAEKISDEEKKLLRVAVLLHDAGFIYVYKDHEEKGCGMANEYLPGFGFSPEQIDIICGMIRATKIPQDPKTKPGQIIADADLDYLGREDVYPIAQTLFAELKMQGILTDEKEWLAFQVSFLKKHHYHTDYSKNLREGRKQQYLEELLLKITDNS